MRILLTEDFTELNIPDEIAVLDIEFEDLGIEVEEEGVVYTNTSGPMNDYGDTGEIDVVYHGTVDHWTWYDYEPTEQDFAEYLKVSADKLTDAMLADIDVEDFINFLASKYEEDAIEDARENYNSDDVDWDEDAGYDYYDESLEEGKKRKKKPYSSMTYTTGCIAYNIDQFNKHMGTDFKPELPEDALAAEEGAGDAADAGSDGAAEGADGAGNAGAGDGGAMGESLTEDRIFSPKAGMWVEGPADIHLLDKAEVSRVIQTLAPVEQFTVGYITPIYFYKKLLNKFTLLKCTEMTGFTGMDYRDVSGRYFYDNKTALKTAADQIANPEGETDYGRSYNKQNSHVKSRIDGMRKAYGQGEINKTVMQGDKTIYKQDENGKLMHDENGDPIVQEVVTDLKTILFYPTPGSKPQVKYFLDLLDGRGPQEIPAKLLKEVIYKKVYDLTAAGYEQGVISSEEDMTDTEITFLHDVENKVQAVIDNEQKTTNDTTMSKASVRALYTGQLYYLSTSKEVLGKPVVNKFAESMEKLDEAKRYVRRYYIRPQQIFCSNKTDILKALIDLDDQNCSVYTLNNLGDEKDVTKLTNKDIIYYYDDGILYDKNHVKVMDYDLSIKHEEERQKFTGGVDAVSDAVFADEYDDRMTDATKTDDVKEEYNPFNEE